MIAPSLPSVDRAQLRVWLDSLNPSSPLGIPRPEELRRDANASASGSREHESRNVARENGSALAARRDIGAARGAADTATHDDFFHASNLTANATPGSEQ